jgi:GNAT superfamily N-acetyltransferase
VFRPSPLESAQAAVRAELAEQLGTTGHPFLVARGAGGDVGVLSIGPPLDSPLYIPDGAAYVGATAVIPDERDGGVGAALVDAALDGARDHGHRAACLHVATANPLSSSFWPGIGFVPAMAHLRRRLDERIVTARP